jgi:hypothetical protein
LFARHFGAAPDEVDTVTVTLMAGIGGADLGGGIGVQLQVLWQATEAMALGVALGGAGGGDPQRKDRDPDNDHNDDAPLAPKTILVALRGFGRVSSRDADWVAATFGAGIAATTRGLWAVTLDGGGLVGGTLADTVEPTLGVAAALSIPLAQGQGIATPTGVRLPTNTLYLGGSLGLAAHLGDTDNTLSAELGAYRGFAMGGARATVYALSFADGQGLSP